MYCARIDNAARRRAGSVLDQYVSLRLSRSLDSRPVHDYRTEVQYTEHSVHGVELVLEVSIIRSTRTRLSVAFWKGAARPSSCAGDIALNRLRGDAAASTRGRARPQQM